MLEELGNYAKQIGKELINKIMSKKAKMYFYIALAVILLVILVFFALFGSITAEAAEEEENMQAASVTSWNQFLRYVETKEGGTTKGDNYVVENDGAGNPTVGHGLCLKSGDGYLHVGEFAEYGIDSKALKLGDEVSIEICDEIWSNHIKGLYEGIVSEFGDLTQYQQFALTDVKYRRGNVNGFSNAYNSETVSYDDYYGNYNESNEKFSDENKVYNFFWDGGHSLEGVKTRKKDQWVLFKYGYYRPLGEYWQANSGTADVSGLQGGSDYKGTFTSATSGLTFIEYYQDAAKWGKDELTGSSSASDLAAAGCHVTSMAIALTGLSGEQITPSEVNKAFNFMANGDAAILNTSEFSRLKSLISISNLYTADKTTDTLKSNLTGSKVMILRYNAEPWTSSGSHYVVAVDYNKDDKVYIINPGTWGKEGVTAGWVKVSDVACAAWQEYIVLSKK